MKNKSLNISTGGNGGNRVGFFGFLCLLCLLLFILPAPARAQIAATDFSALTSVPASMPSNTTSNSLTSSVINLRQGRGVALSVRFVAADAGTSNITFGFDVSLDGTNYSTTQPVSIVATANGTNTVQTYTNVPASWLDNAQKMRLTKVINLQTNVLTINNVTASFGAR
jgi:hypothetical protein